MCLFFTIVFAGPRVGIILWWLIGPHRWSTAFSSLIFPILGFLFLPWTTLMFVAVAPFGNVAGWDWFWLALAVFIDFIELGGAYRSRSQVPYYA